MTMTLRRASTRTAIALCGAIFFLPYLVMLVDSFRPSASIHEAPLSVFGGGWSLHNYQQVLEHNHILRFYINSVVVTTGIVGLQLLLGIPAAFALGHLEPIGSGVIRVLVIVALSVPTPAIAITNYLAISHLGLIDTRLGLVVPFAASAFGLYLMSQYAASVPRTQLDVSSLFGLGIVSRFLYVVLPQMRPGIYAFTVFAFIGWWNEFFWPFIVLQDQSKWTVPFSIYNFLFNSPSALPDWGPLMAAATVALLPLIVFLVLVRRSFSKLVAFAQL